MFLYGASALGPSDIWSVGFRDNTTPGSVVEHFDGSNWTTEYYDTGAGDELRSVVEISPTDIWAVGTMNHAAEALHFNGTGWTPSSLSNLPYQGSAVLESVTATSSSDVWASGLTVLPSGGHTPLVEHFDGSAWSLVPPAPDTCSVDDSLDSISAVNAKDVWSVGQCRTASHVEHWDGSTWSVIALPSDLPGSPTTATGAQTLLESISAAADGTVLVGGWEYAGGGADWGPVVLRYENGTFEADATPSDMGLVEGIDAVNTHDAWAVTVGGKRFNQFTASLYQWNGDAWQRADIRFPQIQNTALSITHDPSTGDPIAAGWMTPANDYNEYDAVAVVGTPQPGQELPEVPFVMLLPIAGLGLLATVSIVRRRRDLDKPNRNRVRQYT